MEHLKHYKLLVKRAKKRQLAGYIEKHHVIPRKCGGTNNDYNLIELTAREHFIAHKLLAKICSKVYGEKHPYTIKMKYAVYNFTARKANKNADYKITAREYEILKKQRSMFLSEQIKEDYISGKRKPYWLGKSGPHKQKHSIESKNKMSVSRSGKKTGDNNPAVKSRQTFRYTFVDGHTEICVGRNKFCRENGYNRASIFSLYTGKITKYKDLIKVEKL